MDRDGVFAFATRLTNGRSYRVSVTASPAGFDCTPPATSGIAGNGSINVTISCTQRRHNVGGAVSNLNAGASVRLIDVAAACIVTVMRIRHLHRLKACVRYRLHLRVDAQPGEALYVRRRGPVRKPMCHIGGAGN